MNDAQFSSLGATDRMEAVYNYLDQHDAYQNWEFPDGAPWGWNDDGTSQAPSFLTREAHITWYHDVKEMLD